MGYIGARRYIKSKVFSFQYKSFCCDFRGIFRKNLCIVFPVPVYDESFELFLVNLMLVNLCCIKMRKSKNKIKLALYSIHKRMVSNSESCHVP